jgi:hypothetical protein
MHTKFMWGNVLEKVSVRPRKRWKYNIKNVDMEIIYEDVM